MARKYKKKAPKRYRKRYQRKKRVTHKRIPRGLPDRMRVTLNYQYDRTYISGTLPGNSYGGIEYKLNSVHDPYASAGGTQPPLYDTYKSLYGKWRVNKVRVTARLQNYTSVPLQAAWILAYDPSTNTPAFPNAPGTYNIKALASSVRSAVKTMNPTECGGGCSTVVRKTFYFNRIVQDYFTSVNFTGDTGDPANIIMGEILVIPQATGTQAWGCWAQIEISYDVTFYDRQELKTAEIN